jgi:hypothetical protein
VPPFRAQSCIVLTLAGLAAACGAPVPAPWDLDRDQVDVVITIPPETAEEAVTLDETTEGFRLGASDVVATHTFSRSPTGVILANGDVVVNDVWSSQVRRYDSHGALVWTAGGEGEGPGEFRGVDWVGLSPDGTIAAWSASNARISFFDEDGRFLDRRQIEPQMVAQRRQPFIGFFPDGSTPLRWLSDFNASVASRPVGRNVWADSSRVVRYRADGGLADTLSMGPGSDRYLFEEDGSRVLITPLLGGEPLEAMSGELLFLGHSSAPYLFGVTAEGDTVVRLGFDVRRPVTPLHADRVAELRVARLATIPDDAPAPFRAAWESAPVAETLPVWTRLVGTSEGSLWLGLFEPDGDGETTWINLSASGELLRSLRLKDGGRILDARDGNVLIGWEDGLGRPLVALHMLPR